MFEEIFQNVDESATFQYFKSFRRVRVNFANSEYAAMAKLQVHEMKFCGQEIKCYLTQVNTRYSLLIYYSYKFNSIFHAK